MVTIPCVDLVGGTAAGPVLRLTEPISLWGGVDIDSGRVIDVRHPQYGAAITGRVVVLPGGRGSSSSASVLVEMVRRGTAPAGLVCKTIDPVLVVGATVASQLYGLSCPVVLVADEIPEPARRIRLDGTGTLEIL